MQSAGKRCTVTGYGYMGESKKSLYHIYTHIGIYVLSNTWLWLTITINISIILAGPIPLRVREAQIPVVNDNECVRKINAVTEKIFILPASSFCAGGEEGHDACQVINKKMHLEKNMSIYIVR